MGQFEENKMIKKLENKLLKQKIFFENLISGMNDWVRVIDGNNRVIFMNEPMKKNLGDNEGKVCYLTLGKKSPCKNCITNKSITEDKISIKEEVVNGRTYSVVSSPIKDENGNVTCAVEVFRDITEAKVLEAMILQQNQKMKKDLKFAKQLQHKILPENKTYYDTLKVESRYIPSETLGGDVYDVVEIDDENIGLYIADVSGHGVTSSMMTMFIGQTLKNLSKNAIDPEVTLKYLSQRYRELNLDDQYYITLFYGVYNKSNKIFTYSNAGHNCMPIVIRSENILELELPGLPICTLVDEVKYEKRTLKIEKGDKIVYYTDGIVEARNSFKEFYGSENIVNICKKNNHKSIKALINIIIDEVNAFSQGNIADDMAIMIGEIV